MHRWWLVAVIILAGFFAAAPALADHVPPGTTVIDLTGETCLGGHTTIDPDGPGGPLPAFTYCVMLGAIGAGNVIQIDDLDGTPPVPGDPASVANGNLYVTSTGSANQPVIGGATYIDWANLAITNLTGTGAAPLGSVENHRILDFTANDDFTILSPGSCLNDGSALPKEDFTQTYIGNTTSFNPNYLFMGQERRTNNGNSVYYWLLTREPVIVVQDGACGGQTRGEVQAKLTDGDVEIIVNFPDSSDPAGGGVFTRTYSGATTAYMPLKDAIFFDPPGPDGWGATLTAVPNLAVNTTPQPFGPWGGIDSHGDPVANIGGGTPTGNHACTSRAELDNCLTVAEFAEWAINLNTFFSGSICGQSLFLTGVSRSSTGQVTSLTEPSDLKDIVGPKLYSFGGVTATASLTPSCSLDIGFTGSAVSPSGALTPANALYSWQFFKCDTPATCDLAGQAGALDANAGTEGDVASGTHTVSGALGAGTYFAVLTVTEDGTSCSDTAVTNVVVLSPFSVTVTADDSCSLVLNYTAATTGAVGAVSCNWSASPNAGLTGANCLQSGDTPPLGGSCDVNSANTGPFVVTASCSDNRGTFSCPASNSDPATVFGPISVNITPDATSLICPAVDTAGTDVTYTAQPSGGDGNYTFDWTVGGAAVGADCIAPSGDGTATCTVDSAASDYCADITVRVRVDDGFGLCGPADSEIETVSKVTIVTATNNPAP